MSKNNIKYRVATQNDIPQLVALMNSQYARKKTEAYFQWQFFNSFYPTVMMCAVDGDIVVGMFGMQKRMTKSGAIAGQAIDLLLKPDYRGKGIFQEMGKQVVDALPGLDLLCVLPNLNGKNACEKALGWKVLGKIDSLELSAFPPKSILDDVDVDCQGKDLEQFTYNDKINDWRFGGNPDYSYHYVRIDKDDFAIIKLFEEPVTGKRYGDIVNYSCDMNDSNAMRTLFYSATKKLLMLNVESVTTWALPHTVIYKVLADIGFSLKVQERYFCVEILNKAYDHLYDIRNWHLVQSDAEIF